MSDPKLYQQVWFTLPDEGLRLLLHRRIPARPNAPAVLLSHGGNTNSGIYRTPGGGLAEYLYEAGWDPWMLDWRGSTHVIEQLEKLNLPRETEMKMFSLDRVASKDFPEALRVVRQRIGDETPLSIIGYCLSSGAVSIALSRGLLKDFHVHDFVLLSLGLFYEVPWNGWIKAEDYILERTLSEEKFQRVIDPNHPEHWPRAMAWAYERWPKSLLPPPLSQSDDMLRRLSFMLGTPWTTQRLHPSLRGDVRKYFGGFHIGLYLHAAQNVRRGYAASFDAPETPVNGVPPASDLNAEYFKAKRIRIVCAQNNGVWHRTSADLMHGWLRQHTEAESSKYVARGYNLHELLWGEHAREQVWPEIVKGLRR